MNVKCKDKNATFSIFSTDYFRLVWLFVLLGEKRKEKQFVLKALRLFKCSLIFSFMKKLYQISFTLAYIFILHN